MRRRGSVPNEEGENNNSSKQVVDQEEDGVAQRSVRLRLLVLARAASSYRHDVTPALKRGDLEEDEQGLPETVEGELRRRPRIVPDSGDEVVERTVGERICRVLADTFIDTAHVAVIAFVEDASKYVQTPHGIGDHIQDGE